jgi:lambda family phage tail tape measure protein
LIDAIKVIPRILDAVASSFQVVGADIDVVGKAATLTNPILFGVAKASGRNPAQELADAVVARNELLAQANEKYAALLNGEVDATQKAVRAQIESRKSLNNFLKGIGTDAMLDDAMFGGGEALKKLNFAPTDAKLAAAELKLYQGAVKRLVDELGNLNHQSEQEKLAFELFGKNVRLADGSVVHLTGNLEKLTPAHKAMLPILAAEIDKRRALIMVSKLNGEAYDALYKSQQQLLSLQTSAFQADRDYIEDLKFQISLIGKTRMEQEKLNEVRKIDVKLRNDLKAAADAAGDNMEQYDAARAVLLRQAEDQKTAVLEGVAVRVQAERDWMTGANAAMNDYIDHATNAAEQSRNLFTRAFQAMEDALVEFARTGKLDFKKLADSIIADIIRIQTRLALTKAIEGAGGSGIFGLIGKLFGFGSGGGGEGTASMAAAAGNSGALEGALLGPFARGGVFDTDGIQAFARGGIVGAPHRFRFADGGMMRHGIMGEAGPEAILPLKRVNGQLGVSASGSEGGPVVQITQNIQVDSRSDIASVRAAMAAAKNEAVREVANQVRRGGGFRKAVRG